VKASKTVTVVPFKNKYKGDKKGYIKHVLYEVLNDFMVGITIKEVQYGSLFRIFRITA